MRRQRRVPLAASVTLTFDKGGETRSLNGMTADISFTGMGLYIPKQLKKDTAVTIDFNFIASAGIIKVETLKGRVVFAEFVRDTYFTGIEFFEELSSDPEREPVLCDRILDILEGKTRSLSYNQALAEKRRHKRVPLAALVTLAYEGGEDMLYLQGMVASISSGGVGLYLGKTLEDGTDVTLEVIFLVSGGEVKTETVKGTVVYSNLIRNTYFVGIEFDVELTPKGQPELYRRIQKILELS